MYSLSMKYVSFFFLIIKGKGEIAVLKSNKFSPGGPAVGPSVGPPVTGGFVGPTVTTPPQTLPHLALIVGS